MNQCVVQPNSTWPGFRQNPHQFQIYTPESCGTEAAKVRNLRTQLRELDSQIREVDRLQDNLEFLSKAELVTSIVMETSIGFLDLAAAILEPVNPFASQTAKTGVSGIRSVKALGEYSNGKLNKAQLATELTSQSLNVVKPKGLAGKVALQQAKMHVDAVAIAVNSSSGVSQEKLAAQSLKFAKDRALGNLGVAGDALGEASKTAKVAKGLSLLDGVYTAAIGYGDALEGRFNTRLEQRMSTQQWAQTQKANLKHLMARVKELLAQATSELEACTVQAG